MNGRTLNPLVLVAVVATIVLLHLAGVVSSLGDPAALRTWQDVAGWLAALFGASGALAATFAFSKGDYLRRVWALFAVGAVLLLVGTALRSHWTHVAPDRSFLESPLLPVRAWVVVVANLGTMSAMILLVLTHRRAGLQPEPDWRANLLWVLTGAAALAVAVPALMLELGRIGGGPPQTWASLTIIASTIGDFTTVLLIAPILRVAYMLRGGKLAWVWWAMALSGAFWLLYDAREWLSQVLPGNPDDNLQLVMVTRSPGLAFVGLAGWLQRFALASSRTSGVRPAASLPAA